MVAICTSSLSCKQRYDKTHEEMEMKNFLTYAYCFALMGPAYDYIRNHILVAHNDSISKTSGLCYIRLPCKLSL